MKKKLFGFLSVIVAFLASFFVFLSGCNQPSQPVPPDVKAEKVAATIKTSAQTVVSIGLVAIPNPQEADEVAITALGVLDKSILPILNGDEEGFKAGIMGILSLKAFDNPKLSKVKLLLSTGLPILFAYIPNDLADNTTASLSPDMKKYIKAFFEGARDGCSKYVDGSKGPGKNQYQDLRLKLSE